MYQVKFRGAYQDPLKYENSQNRRKVSLSYKLSVNHEMLWVVKYVQIQKTTNTSINLENMGLFFLLMIYI